MRHSLKNFGLLPDNTREPNLFKGQCRQDSIPSKELILKKDYCLLKTDVY